jgi:hypothetical protein
MLVLRRHSGQSFHFRLIRDPPARRYGFCDGGSNVSGIAGAGDRRQGDRHGAVLARRVYPVEAERSATGSPSNAIVMAFCVSASA